MNKLVSKNPVLRFKLGKLILKFQNGGPNGAYFEETDSSGKIIGKGRWLNGKKVYYKPVTNTNIDEVTVIGNGRPKQIYSFGKMGGWNRSIGKGTINDSKSLKMLEEMGMSGKTAKDIQDEINNAFGKNSVKSDNMWGNLSRRGLQALYERWKSLNPQTKLPTYVSPLEAIKAPEVLLEMKNWMNLEAISQNPTIQTDLNIINNNNLSFKRNANLNKSLTRDLMRSFGLNPYAFSGALRKALRLYKNGLSDDISLLRGTPLYDLFVTPYLYKTGGQLVSRNPILRFKTLKKK